MTFKQALRNKNNGVSFSESISAREKQSLYVRWRDRFPIASGCLIILQSSYRAMSVLIAASPCGLAIFTPSAVSAGIARAARQGVLIKGGRPLEDLASIRAVAFDKTRTPTKGKPTLTRAVPCYEQKTADINHPPALTNRTPYPAPQAYFCIKQYSNMKKILIPIDFSKNSLRAMEYGLSLAADLGSTVTLLYSYEGYQPGHIMDSVQKMLEEEAQIEMNNVFEDAQNFAPSVALDQKAVQGQAADEIINAAKSGDYDLVVMGTNGASGLKEIFIGSVANRVISHTKTPVIVVPVGCKYRSYKTIILSLSDDLIKEANIIAPLAELVRKTEADLEVYHFGKMREKKGELAENLAILDGMTDCSMTYAYGTDQEDVNARIKDFAEEKDADLLCLIRRKRNFWATLFGKSVTSRQTFHSHIPLLILHNEE